MKKASNNIGRFHEMPFHFRYKVIYCTLGAIYHFLYSITCQQLFVGIVLGIKKSQKQGEYIY